MPLPTEPIGPEPKSCCGSGRTTPFCPICGTRLTTNEYIGHGYNSIQHEIDSVAHDLRGAEESVREIQRRYDVEMKPAQQVVERHHAKLRKLHDAKEYARKHQIGT